ncbi:exodeoxyribonuclease III [Deinococcus pimensis]|uniref:exodeoxyribonuclease III n=1 Tax=Deinococcus pimensis TaxID=309888 RepID=UPI0004881222
MTPDAPAHPTIATFNVNGLRSALKKGLLAWFEEHRPDVALLQEVRADPHPEVFSDLGYHSVWLPATRAGYSGVAILSRREPDEVEVGVGHEAYDAEGRVLVARFGDLRVGSVYVPSGSSGDERQAFKEAFLAHLSDWTRARLAQGPLVLGGDFNVAHSSLDLRNWRSNQKNSGFLPQERAWFGEFLGLGLRDAHREHLGERAEYTWWSNRGAAYEKDVGWRLDYLLAGGVDLREVRVHRAPRLSDHAAVTAVVTGPDPVVSALLPS